jgi:hypothetical protein
MRTAEARDNPEQYRCSQGGGVEAPIFFGRKRYALAVGTLAGALLACASAQAQSAVEIEDRIEATFDLVLSNSAELAVPLTRRALVRRSQEDERIEALPYSATDLMRTLGDAKAMQIEEGSAEDDAAAEDIIPARDAAAAGTEIEIARLPRPRPVVFSEATGTDDLVGKPLDLVAGAAVAVPDDKLEEGDADLSPISYEDASSDVASETSSEGEEVPLILAANTAAAPASPELVTAGDCLALGDVADKDGDFKRNADVLSGTGFCIGQQEFKERKRPWVIQTVASHRPGPLWAVMHDDEDMSFDTAVEAVKTHGGTLVAVETGGKRNLSGVDPNRNFSGEGIGCSKLGSDAAPQYTRTFRDLIDPAQPIIALHNNSDERIPTGGNGHLTMDHVPKDMRASPAPDRDGPLAGEHALVLLAASDLDDPTATSRAEVLNGKGLNVVLERVEKGRGDCSLSNFAVLIGNPNYFNVTVDHGQRDKQMRIIDVLMSGRSETVASQ